MFGSLLKLLYLVSLSTDVLAHYTIGNFYSKRNIEGLDLKSSTKKFIKPTKDSLEKSIIAMGPDILGSYNSFGTYIKKGVFAGHAIYDWFHTPFYPIAAGLYTKARGRSFREGFALGGSHWVLDFLAGGPLPIIADGKHYVQLYPEPEELANPVLGISLVMLFHLAVILSLFGIYTWKEYKSFKEKFPFISYLKAKQ